MLCSQRTRSTFRTDCALQPHATATDGCYGAVAGTPMAAPAFLRDFLQEVVRQWVRRPSPTTLVRRTAGGAPNQAVVGSHNVLGRLSTEGSRAVRARSRTTSPAAAAVPRVVSTRGGSRAEEGRVATSATQCAAETEEGGAAVGRQGVSSPDVPMATSSASVDGGGAATSAATPSHREARAGKDGKSSTARTTTGQPRVERKRSRKNRRRREAAELRPRQSLLPPRVRNGVGANGTAVGGGNRAADEPGTNITPEGRSGIGAAAATEAAARGGEGVSSVKHEVRDAEESEVSCGGLD